MWNTKRCHQILPNCLIEWLFFPPSSHLLWHLSQSSSKIRFPWAPVRRFHLSPLSQCPEYTSLSPIQFCSLDSDIPGVHSRPLPSGSSHFHWRSFGSSSNSVLIHFKPMLSTSHPQSCRSWYLTVWGTPPSNVCRHLKLSGSHADGGLSCPICLLFFSIKRTLSVPQTDTRGHPPVFSLLNPPPHIHQ